MLKRHFIDIVNYTFQGYRGVLRGPLNFRLDIIESCLKGH